jgi:O-antigen ligase
MRSLALRILQIGAVAAVLAVVPTRAYDLDRFLAPKEVALHATAVLAGIAVLFSKATASRRTPSLALILFLALSGVSAVLAANRWLAIRSVAITASGIALFFIAQRLDDWRVRNAVAIAGVVASITSLAQAYGVRLHVFASTRSPGGTLGNRNFVGHVGAIVLPVLFARSYRIGIPGVAIVAAAMVLTRSRAAWLAAAAMLAVYVIAVIAQGEWALLRKFFVMIAAAAAGVAAALVIPNTLRWNSENPYVESMQEMANYQEGSGRGRLLQYERSLRIAVRHPLFGIGPGNWPVVYPKQVPRNDPSLDGRRTFNPWPSSDWVAYVTERGFPAAVLLLLGLAGIARRSDPPALGVLAAATVAGLFDAVLLLALPTLLVWTAVGSSENRGDLGGELQRVDGLPEDAREPVVHHVVPRG